MANNSSGGSGKNPFASGSRSNNGAQSQNPFKKSSTGINNNARSNRPLPDNFAQRVAQAKNVQAPAEEMNGENYLKVYEQKKRADQATLAQKNRDEAKKNEANATQQKKILDEKIANDFRARARDLRAQISFWQQQLGQDVDTNMRANNNIQTLMNELGGIPAQYQG